MAELTRAGVCYDLADTPYTAEWRGFTFYFSSYPHRRKFERELCKKLEWVNDSMSRRFHMGIDMSEVAAVHWYRMVETRGFRVVTPYGVEYRRCSDMGAAMTVDAGV